MDWAIERYPGKQVRRMPHNNPGYDILVLDGNRPVRYIEVKGTTRKDPYFFLSENERRFSEANADLYEIVVFYSIYLEEESGTPIHRSGALGTEQVGLQVVQWQGRLPFG